MEYQHKEAFCLMNYRCEKCGHKEVMWNSRDGITPFCTACPSCGQPSLVHIDWFRDLRVVGHKPHLGQRVWASMTAEEVRQLFLQRRPEKAPTQEEVDEILNQYGPGGTPAIRIAGYTRNTQTEESSHEW